MEIKKLESRIKEIKAKMKSMQGGTTDAALVRATRKRLKRAQRKKRVLLKKIAKIEAQGKKKEQTAS